MRDNHHYRFFVKPDSIKGDLFVSGEKDLVNQIKNVFRLKPEAEIFVLNGEGEEFIVKLESITKNNVSGKIIEHFDLENKNSAKTILFIPVIKNSNFDLILEKCTELGVDEFQPVIYEHSVIRKTENKDRWNKIVKEASEQSGRKTMPKVRDVLFFSDAIDTISNENVIVLFEGSKTEISSLGKNVFAGNQIILVGPEGGFSDSELSELEKRKFNFFKMGDNILRAETACISGVGFISFLC